MLVALSSWGLNAIIVFHLVTLTLLPAESANLNARNEHFSKNRQARQRVGFAIKPQSCEIAREEGTCMFVWECLKSGGRHLGMCMDGFMFGSCCVHEEENSEKPPDKPNTTSKPNKVVSQTEKPSTTTPQSIKTTVSSSDHVRWPTRPPRPSRPSRPTKPRPFVQMTTTATTTTTTLTTTVRNKWSYSSTESYFPSDNDIDLNEVISTSEAGWTTKLRPTRPSRPPKPTYFPPVIEKQDGLLSLSQQSNRIKSENIGRPKKSPPLTTTTTTSATTTTTRRTTTTAATTTTTTKTTTTTTPSTTQLSTWDSKAPSLKAGSTIQAGSGAGSCGLPAIKKTCFQGRIVNGTQSCYGQFPWQVSVRRTSFFGFSSTHRCGGALINEYWVATAGHCVDDLLINKIRVRIGEWDFSLNNEPDTHTERKVVRKIVHADYNFFTYENDLALLKLEKKVDFADNVIPICLPGNDDLLVGEMGTVAGWGRLSEGGQLPNILHYVSVPIVSNAKCKSMFLKAGRHEVIPDIFMCAGYENGGRDSCQGDSGGPLIVKGKDGRWFLGGIISWGIGCAEPNLPGVCTRISKFRSWILEHVT